MAWSLDFSLESGALATKVCWTLALTQPKLLWPILLREIVKVAFELLFH